MSSETSEFKLLKSSQREDVASMSIVMNKNSALLSSIINFLMEETTKNSNRIAAIEKIQESNRVILEVSNDVLHEETLHINDFRITKYIDLTNNMLSFVISDSDTERDTNFLARSLRVFNSDNLLLISNYELYSSVNSLTINLEADSLPQDKSLRFILI